MKVDGVASILYTEGKESGWPTEGNCGDCSVFTLEAQLRDGQVIPTPLHVLDRISPIFSPFFPVFCAFSPPGRGGSNEPQAGTQGDETAARGPRAENSALHSTPQTLTKGSTGRTC